MSPSHPRFAMETPGAKHAEIIDTTIGQQLTKIIAEWFKRNELVLASENWPSVPSWLLFGYVSESSGIDLCAKPLTEAEDDLLRRGLLRLKFGKSGIPKMVGTLALFDCYQWRATQRDASTSEWEPYGPVRYGDENGVPCSSLPPHCRVNRRTDLLGIAVHLETDEGYFGKLRLGYRTEDRAFTPKPISWEPVGAALPQVSEEGEGYLHFFAPAGAPVEALPA